MDRETVRNVLDWYKHSHPKEMSGPKYIDFNLIGELVVHGYVHYEDLKGIPAADVVEVVRCKDCIYHTEDNECANGRWDNWSNSDYGLYPEALEMDYCSYGVRKNG